MCMYVCVVCMCVYVCVCVYYIIIQLWRFVIYIHRARDKFSLALCIYISYVGHYHNAMRCLLFR